MRERLGIIGDVHGDLEAVEQLVSAVRTKIQRFVFVGDYVNRGPSSAGVIEFLCSLREESPNTVFLEGNHETAFRSCLEDGQLVEFLQIGGAATIRSYVGDVPPDVLPAFVAAIPPAHRRFLADLVPRFADHEVLVTHKQEASAGGPQYRISGHSVQRNRIPKVGSNGAQIDTGCGLAVGAPLTCLFWPSLQWVQAASST